MTPTNVGRAASLLIAHRGESYDAPENTLAAVALAWERGARAVEIDVRRTVDGRLVVIHDPDTRRIGGPRRKVAEQTLAGLRELDAGRWKHVRWAGERIPLLDEVLQTVPAHGRLFIEIKDGPECVAPLTAALDAHLKNAARQALVMSFQIPTVAEAAQALPGVEICLLAEARDYLGQRTGASLIARACELGCRSLDVEAHRRLDAEFVREAHQAGLRIYVWTVNRLGLARRLAAAGVDGITTDRCAWMTERMFKAQA